jgi:hypothetical protein
MAESDRRSAFTEDIKWNIFLHPTPLIIADDSIDQIPSKPIFEIWLTAYLLFIRGLAQGNSEVLGHL